MIEYLSGICRAKTATSLVLDVNGVGYGVEAPLSTLCEIGAIGSPVNLWIETQVREDAIKLFGFLNVEEKQAFNMVRSVNGVGPKIALALLSALDTKLIRQAVYQDRKDIFENVPGVGKRLAERLVLELKAIYERKAAQKKTIEGAKAKDTSKNFDEFAVPSIEKESIVQDVQSALENLGYKERDVIATLEKIRPSAAELNFNQLMKSALMELRSNF